MCPVSGVSAAPGDYASCRRPPPGRVNHGDFMAKKHSPGFLSLVNSARTRVTESTVHDVHWMKQEGREFLLVDVREDAEWAKSRIPGSRHLGKGILERDVEELVPDAAQEIVLYCGGGFRSALAADTLRLMGYSRASSMAGGLRGWREAGYAEDVGPFEGTGW
jgi:rhodanese-related sulfurtransferase